MSGHGATPGDFEALLDRLVPGAGRTARDDPDDDGFPSGLGLEPLGVLGRGASGTVYRARDPLLDRVVAVKVARGAAGDAGVRSLVAEARLTASLSHPAVLPVHRITVVGDACCVEYRLAPERSLAALFAELSATDAAGWPVERRLRLVEGLASAVAAAHRRGLVHGDIHPGNAAVGADGEPYLLDWTGPGRTDGFSGHAGYAAPECLRGSAPSPASDVYALGVVAWELLTLRRMRARLPDESLGEFVARWGQADVLAPSRFVPIDSVIDAWVLAALAPDRPEVEVWRAELDRILTGRADRTRRQDLSDALLHRVRDDLTRLDDLARRRRAELEAAAVLTGRVAGHAAVAQKRAGWAAEDRAEALADREEAAWIEATEGATLASTLAPGPEAGRLLSQLWFDRMRRAEDEHEPRLARLAEGRVRRWDDGPFTRLLDAPARLSLTVDTLEATATVERFALRDRRLLPVPVATWPLPFEAELPPGSYRVTVDAPGHATTHYPVLLERGARHLGRVRLFRPEEVGEGFVHLPAGSFKMGGDPKARQPLAACEPFVDDCFVARTCVTTPEYLAFLDALGPVDGARHVPGEAGFFGRGAAYWTWSDGRWRLPEGWHPGWPVFAVNLADIEAYCAWRSLSEGRVIRLPTEEEWEKAARGVDGRAFPWGPGFDPTYAHMRRSRPGPPRPWPVADYPVDESVYGVRDLAGGLREWTSSWFDEGQIVLRGGTWGDDADDCRCACRSGVQPGFRYSFVGFRVVAEPPPP